MHYISISSHSYSTFQGSDNEDLLPLRQPSHHSLGLLGQHVYQRFILNTPREGSTCRKIASIALPVIIGLMGAEPYGEVSLDLAGRGILGYSLASGNVLALASLNGWALHRIFKAFFSLRSEEEKELLKGGVKEKIILCIALLIGVGCQVPQAYVSYTYDHDHLYDALATLIACSFVPGCSFKLLYDKIASMIASRIGHSNFEGKLRLSKTILIKRLKNNIHNLAKLSKNERDRFFERINEIKTPDEVSQQMSRFLSMLFSTSDTQEVENVASMREVGGCTRYITTRNIIRSSVGGTLGGSRLAIIGITSYKAIKLFTDSTPVCGIFATLITFFNALLVYKLLFQSCTKLYDTAIGCLPDKKSTTFSCNFSCTFSQILSTVLKVVMIGIVFFSWGPSYQVPRDNTSGDFRTFMEITVVIGALIVYGTTLFDVAEGLVEKYVSCRGSDEEKRDLIFNEEANHLRQLIKKSPPKSFAKFMTLLPEKIVGECYEKGGFDRSDLMGYLLPEEDEMSPLRINSRSVNADEDWEDIDNGYSRITQISNASSSSSASSSSNYEWDQTQTDIDLD